MKFVCVCVCALCMCVCVCVCVRACEGVGYRWTREAAFGAAPRRLSPPHTRLAPAPTARAVARTPLCADATGHYE